MHHIKKYANRKMYDVTDKKYVTMADIADIVQSGEDIRIVDNTNGEDITQEVVSQLLGRMFDDQAQNLPVSVLMKLLRKGSGGIVGYTRKYLSLYQNAINFAEDKLDKVDALIGIDEPHDSGREKKSQDTDLEDGAHEHLEMLKLLDQSIDQRLEERLSNQEVDIQQQLARLNADVTKLTARIETFENIFSQVLKTAGGSAPESSEN